MGFPALRARQFLVALLEAGHQVAFASLLNGNAGRGEGRNPPRGHQQTQPTAVGPLTFESHAVRLDQPGAFLTLRDLRHEFQPDCVISAGPFAPMAGGARAVGEEPLWVDVPGDPMAEAQLRAHRGRTHEPIHRYRQVLSLALTRGDHFSVVSGPQRAALVGALGLAGRLTATVIGQELVEVMPPTVEGLYRDCPPESPGDLLTGIAPRDFAVLFCGGYNTWLDVDTLSTAVLKAMDADERIHLVSTGGALAGHEEGSFKRFKKLAARSRHAKRFHFLGWVPARHLDAVYGACDMVVNVDVPCYEAEFGSRTRLLDAMERGLLVAATDTCELTHDLSGVEGFFPQELGNPDQLASLVVRLAGEKRRRMDTEGRPTPLSNDPLKVPWSDVRGRYSIATTCRAMLDWVENPQRSHQGVEVDFVEDQWSEISRLQERLEEVWTSPTWKYLGRVHKVFRQFKD